MKRIALSTSIMPIATSAAFAQSDEEIVSIDAARQAAGLVDEHSLHQQANLGSTMAAAGQKATATAPGL